MKPKIKTFNVSEIIAVNRILLMQILKKDDQTIEWQTLISPVIWNGKDTTPAAFIIDKKAPAQLEVIITLDGAIPPGNYTLKGIPADGLKKDKSTGDIDVNNDVNNDANRMMFSGSGSIQDTGESEYPFTVTLENGPEDFWGFSTDFKWLLHLENEEAPITGTTTPLELYWLYDYDESLFFRGVPIEILRQVNLACRTIIEPDSSQAKADMKTLVIRTVVNACFFRNPPRYDVTDKWYHYGNYDDFNKISLFLAEFLEDWNKPEAVCNCYDQAAVLQVYLKATGIKNVNFVKLFSSFYMKQTYLVGRGWCNDPAYNCDMENQDNRSFLGECFMPITLPASTGRQYFAAHAFCVLYRDDSINDSIKKILDSCIGPHTGDETLEEYILAIVDPYHPENKDVKSPIKNMQSYLDNIREYNGVTSIDQMGPRDDEPESQKAAEFNAMVDASPLDIDDLRNRFLASGWPDISKKSVFKPKGWKLIYQHIIPGPGETMKTWVLRRNAETVTIKIYTASYEGYKGWARNRFIAIGTSSTLPHISFKKGPAFLGPFSVKSVRENTENTGSGRYVWQSFNIVFDVTFNNVTFNPEKLLKWLHKRSIRKPCISNIFPIFPIFSIFARSKSFPADMGFDYSFISIAGSKEGKYSLSTGETFTVSLTPAKHLRYHFRFKSGKDLRFIGKTDDSFTFKALTPSENTLVVMAVHEKKLLSAFKTFDIVVN